jgi:hypothetical protein
MTTSDQAPSVVMCLYNDNVAQWCVKHSPDTEGEKFVGIVFEDDKVTLSTDSGREISIDEEVYKSYDEAVSCSTHSILEFDSFGQMMGEYFIQNPTATVAPSFRG